MAVLLVTLAMCAFGAMIVSWFMIGGLMLTGAALSLMIGMFATGAVLVAAWLSALASAVAIGMCWYVVIRTGMRVAAVVWRRLSRTRRPSLASAPFKLPAYPGSQPAATVPPSKPDKLKQTKASDTELEEPTLQGIAQVVEQPQLQTAGLHGQEAADNAPGGDEPSFEKPGARNGLQKRQLQSHQQPSDVWDFGTKASQSVTGKNQEHSVATSIWPATTPA